jgi:serine protease
VAGTDQLAVVDDDRADRDVVVLEGEPRFVDGRAHPGVVSQFGHRKRLRSNFKGTTLFQSRRSGHPPSPRRPREATPPLPARASRPRLLAAALFSVLAAVVPASARADGIAPLPEHVSGEVVVTYAPGADPAEQASAQRSSGAHAAEAIAPRTKVLHLRHESVAHAIARLRANPAVQSAAPNAIAHASGYIPPDPGRSGLPGGWQAVQWNFAGPYGVNAPDAWSNLMRAGRPGGKGVTVAVLDTGVAYENRGRFRRSPDFRPSHFVDPYDFVGHDRHPDDANGHGTHVTGTINEATGNPIGLTGLAYGAKIMPVRVLDRYGDGDSAAISQGVRYAVSHHAQIINLSFEFDSGTSTRDVPDLLTALRDAKRAGVLVVAASGNEGSGALAYPARAKSVMSVGASTEHGCAAEYSNAGASLDIVAPGGGPDADLPDPQCQPGSSDGRNVVQMTFTGSVRSFGLPGDYTGTSMATPHVSATAALVIASGVLGAHPSPDAIMRRLKATARPLGAARHYGAGLVDAAAATAPAAPAIP